MLNRIARRLERDKPRQPRPALWAVLKYAALTIAGILLFRAGAAYGYAQRGYAAIGGEVFALLLPVLYGLISAVVRDLLRDIKKLDKE